MTAVAIATPRAVFCAIEDRHRDVPRARDVCAGRFTHAGITLSIASPPWRDVDIHPNPEWWIEWTKFDYGLDLAYAFATTGEARFLRTWQALVRSWVEQVPIGFGPADAIGWRLQNWIYAWNIFNRAPAFAGIDAAFERLVVENAAAQAGYLQAHLTRERTHRTLELYALIVVALALPASDPGGARLRFAWDELHRNLLDDFRPDGVHREHSTHYHMVALRSFLAARENARLFGIPVPGSYDERLTRAVEFAMMCQRPDGSIPALSDTDAADYRESLALAATLLDRPDVRYAATNGRDGAAPLCAVSDFPDGGYYIQRSSWREKDRRRQRHLIFDCGPLGDGGLGNCDLLSIDVWAGQPLIVDPGRFTYAEGTPNWRRWFKGTAAHNTVCIDGLDQSMCRPGELDGAAAEGRLVTRLNAPLLDVLVGEAVSPQYDAIHRRHVFFVEDDYWIVLDELEAADEHDYDLRFHLAPCKAGHVVVEDRRVTAPGVALLFDGPGAITIEDGWVAPSSGSRHTAAPVVSFRATGLTSARFVTALIPLAPRRSLERIALSSASIIPGALEMTLTGMGADGTHVDRVRWQQSGGSFSVPGFCGVADAVWTRSNEAGIVLNFSVCGLQLREYPWPAPLEPPIEGGTKRPS